MITGTKRRLAVFLCAVMIIFTFIPVSFANEKNPEAAASQGDTAKEQSTIGEAAFYDAENGITGAEIPSDEVQPQGSYSIKITGTIDYDASYEGLKQLNAIRAEKGLAPLQMSTELLNVANRRAAECAVFYGHTRPDGTDCFAVFPSGYTLAGENIALGQPNITNVTSGWKNSPNHYSNMINGDFTEVGIGCFESANGVKTWVQVFAGGRSFSASSHSGKTSATYYVNTSESNVSISSSATSFNLAKGTYVSFPLYNTNKGCNFVSKTVIYPAYAESGNTNVATYNNGNVYGAGVGSCNVKIGLSSNFYVSSTFNVYEDTSVHVTGLSLSLTSTTMKVGDVVPVTATISPSNATDQNVTWQTSNSSVVGITSTAGTKINLSARGTGTAVITAKCDGKTATCQVKVEAKPADVAVTGVTINNRSLTINQGGVVQITGSTVPTDASSKEITWSISDSSVATLGTSASATSWSAGPIVTNQSTGAVYIKAVSPGSTVLTAKSGNYSITCNIFVRSESGEIVTGVSLNKSSITLNEGESTTLTSTLTPSNLNGNYNVAWSSSNASVAKFETSSPGTITVKALKAGTSTITVRAGNYSASCTVTVKSKDEQNQSGGNSGDNSGNNTGAMNFSDVNKGDWYYDYVSFVYQMKLMSGTGNNRFEPNTSISRAMIVQILYNMQGSSPSFGSKASSFSDVSSADWYRNAVKWAASNGIVMGYEDGSFKPNVPVSREQLVTFLYRYANYKKYSTSTSFALNNFYDRGQVSSYAKTPMEWAYGSGLISGKSSHTLDPLGKATRAETAVMMTKFCKRYNIWNIK